MPASTEARPRHASAPTPLAQASKAPVFNVVICILDAARADRVGCYGYPRDTTPNIDRLARESVMFRNHFATCAATIPSTGALFTGLYPDMLGLERNMTLDPSYPTLAQALRGAGMDTALFTLNTSASPDTGLAGGFQQAFPDSANHRTSGHAMAHGPAWRSPSVITRDFDAWLSTRGSARFFAYLHFLPPHKPYEAGPEFVAAVTRKPAPAVGPRPLPFPELAATPLGNAPYPPREWADRYDANLRRGDWGIGEVVRLLREHRLLESTLLIVTADHGEAFGEHGYVNHVNAVYDEFVHIPLVIRLPSPRPAAKEVTALTQTVDLLPTVCDLLRVPYPHRVQGRSLRPLLMGRGSGVRDYAIAVSTWSAWPAYLVRDERWSLLLYRGGRLKALYDLQQDPAQQRNVFAQHPEVVARLTAAFRAFARTQGRSLEEYVSPGKAHGIAPGPNPQTLSDKARRDLKALGYLQ